KHNPDLPSADIGRSIVKAYWGEATARNTAATVTLAVTDLRQLAPLSASLQALATKLGTANAEGAQQIQRARDDPLHEHGRGPHHASTGSVDLGQLVANVARATPALVPERDAVLAALDGAIVDRAAGPALASSSGISIFLPRAKQFGASQRQSYAKLSDVA